MEQSQLETVKFICLVWHHRPSPPFYGQKIQKSSSKIKWRSGSAYKGLTYDINSIATDNTLGSHHNTLGSYHNTLGSHHNTLGSYHNTLGSYHNTLGSHHNLKQWGINTMGGVLRNTWSKTASTTSYPHYFTSLQL